MEVFYSIEDIHNIGKTGIALGNFDGVHIGHKKLIKNAVDTCKKKGIASVVLTFANHPKNAKQILSWEEKKKIIESLGVEYLVALKFDDHFQKMPAENFIINILLGQLNMQTAFCGFHYHFGYKALGTTDLLEEMSKQYGYELNVLDPVTVEGNLVSSTKIREYISEGKMEKASQLLGRRYSLEGTVIHGRQIGKQIGFPTANFLIDKNRVIPPNGVYITKCLVNNKEWNSITNIGVKPTVGGDKRLIETYIINFDEEIYDEVITVYLYKNIRHEMKYEDLEALKKQINLDVIAARKYHARN